MAMSYEYTKNDQSTENPSTLQRSMSPRSVRRLHGRNESACQRLDSIDVESIQFFPTCMECVRTCLVRKRDDLIEGDHIINSGVLYDHHAIVREIAPDERDQNNPKKATLQLIHVTNDFFGVSLGLFKSCGGKAEIKITYENFDFGRSKIMIVKYFNAKFTAREIIRRAEREQTEQDFDYHLFKNNCEHFATYCVTEEKFSVQVKKLSMTLKMFFSRRFVGLGDEKLRNQVAYGKKLLCTPCFERNVRLLEAEKRPLTKRSEIHKGDIINFSYWNLRHDAIVLAVFIHASRNPMKIYLRIAHYAFRGPFRRRTILAEIKSFPLDGSVTVTKYESPHFNVYSPEETVQRALDRIDEKEFAFFVNDSSHFARACKLKLSTSS